MSSMPSTSGATPNVDNPMYDALNLEQSPLNPGLSPQFAFGFYCTAEYLESVKLILAVHPEVDPSVDDNSAIRTACFMGHHEIMKLLLTDSRVDPSANENEAIVEVCNSSAYERDIVVQLLLADPRVDPAA
jgi:hypothetical protein